MYAVGAPACEVFSDYYSGLCSTREINLKFEAPCESEEFTARYAVLCDEVSFLQTYPIQGMKKLLLQILAVLDSIINFTFLQCRLPPNLPGKLSS
jgi:hypothetical protein